MKKESSKVSSAITRRGVVKSAIAGVAGMATLATGMSAGCSKSQTHSSRRKGNIRQSVVSWCYSKHWSVEETCQHARDLGCESVELISSEHWPTLKKYGLTCAISPIAVEGAPFIKGFNNPEYHPWLLKITKKAIDESADFGCPNVIAFTGYSENFSPEQGAANCVAGFKKLASYAEKKGVNVCMEMLNSRVGGHPDKGHPGYQGDHIDYCMEILNAVGSPNIKLLFDVYHVQIMDGDIIQRIHQCGDMIGHIHTAGNPGRGELDENQEINYPPVMKALLDINYKGFVGQEFIPAGDPRAGLRQAVELCDV
jgi:hydroxypyruvate isomerase